MYVFRKMNSLALMGGLSLVLAGIMACSTDDTTSSKNGEELPIVIDSIVTIDSNGNRVVTYDTIHPTVDSIVQIDGVSADNARQTAGISVQDDRLRGDFHDIVNGSEP